MPGRDASSPPPPLLALAAFSPPLHPGGGKVTRTALRYIAVYIQSALAIFRPMLIFIVRIFFLIVPAILE